MNLKTTSIVIITSKTHKMISSRSPCTGGQIFQKILASQPGLFYSCTRARRAALAGLAARPLRPTGDTCQQLLGSCTLCHLYQRCTLPSGPGNAPQSFPKSPMPLHCLLSSGDTAEDLLLCASGVMILFSSKLGTGEKRWDNCPLRIVVLCVWCVCVLLFQGDWRGERKTW